MRIDRLLISMAGVLFWLSSNVASHHLPVTPQSGQKINFIVLFETLNSDCEVQRVYKNMKKCRD